MRFTFDKAACQNTRRALRKEWLLTNGLGDYASSSILGCNTRKYHGLLVANTMHGRQVLLSTLEESVVGGSKEFFLSTRQHPSMLHPCGYEYQESFQQEEWPCFTYRVGDVRIRREMFMLPGQTRLLIRWTVEGPSRVPPLTLRIKPLLAYRGFHELSRVNSALRVRTSPAERGFGIAPYEGMPPLFIQAGSQCDFLPSPDWYYNIEYLEERARGFADSEDLFQPGIMEIPLPALPQGGSVCLCAGTAPCQDDLEELWQEQTRNRPVRKHTHRGLAGHLADAAGQFCITGPSGRESILAGYHWFDAWGRDTLIALPGLTFCTGQTELGLRVLEQVAASQKNGLTPNCFAEDGNHAWNSADASLWYAFAVQCYLQAHPEGLAWVHEHAWPALKAIVTGYRQGPGMDIFVDDHGLLHAGNAQTQLTWMDAQARGVPVTPRHGCPVEINALWYNTLAFVDHLAGQFREPEWEGTRALRGLRSAFFEHFWVARDGGYLGDVWRDGMLDQSIRPNQILAVSLPYPVLEEQHQPQVVECVRNKLLTPYGLRTLSPDNPQYRGRYEGGPDQRDAAYHQGTVWPWPLGHYTDALLRVAWDVDGAVQSLLNRVTPLFTEHLARSGLGTISEVFDASPPYRAHGCIAQAWSVAEVLRMLIRLRKAAPAVYATWEEKTARLLHNPTGDTAGICRVTLTLD
ncbi:MAG: glycogen debranching enzyme family protein [Desulfovibrio sp.]|nr:glycogen debranching enzyme family protein [Desulfovibrio sp.]